MVKCNACGGEYEPIQPDKTQYFHACPPLSAREIAELLERRAITLPPRDQLRLDEAIAADGKDPLPAGETTRAERVLLSIVVERPNKRDETVLGPAPRGEATPIRADGAGITRI